MEHKSGLKTLENLAKDEIKDAIKEIVENQCNAIRDDFDSLKGEVAAMKKEIDEQKCEKRKTTKCDLRLSPVSYKYGNCSGSTMALQNCSEDIKELPDLTVDETPDTGKLGQASSMNLQTIEHGEQQENMFRTFVYQFVESSTLHGFPRLVDSTIWIRVLWIMGMAGAVTALSIQLVGLSKDYLAFTVTTDVEVKQGNMTFPVITVCNNRRFLASRLASLPLVTNKTGEVNGTLDVLALIKILSNNYNDLTPEDLSELGASVDDTVAVLTYPKKGKAKAEPLPYHGNCYTIKSEPGTTFIMLAFNLHMADAIDIMDNMLQEPGIKINVKGNPLAYHSFEPFHGIEVYNGLDSHNEISYDEINRLNGSYGQCQDDEHAFFTKTGIAYEQHACIRECEFRNIALNCQCFYKESWYFPFWLKNELNKNILPSCNIDDPTHERCMLKVYKDLNCDCKPNCHVKLYRKINQRVVDPGDCMQKPWLIICDLVRQWAPENITKEWLKENIAVARIFHTKEPYKIYTQQPAYPFLHFLSDIGGTMGFYLGASLLTYFELVQLSISCGLFLLKCIKQKCRF